MRITKFKGVCINLFHSGAVMILGATAEQYAPLVKAWLDEIQGMTKLVMEQPSKPYVSPDYDSILKCLPTDLYNRAYEYLKNFPLRLLTSWSRRIRQDVALQHQLIENVQRFV